MNWAEPKLILAALIAAVAGFLGLKAGRRGADKRVAQTATKAAQKMEDKRREDLKDDLADIDARPVTDDPLADLESRLGTGPAKPAGTGGPGDADGGSAA